MALVSRDGHGLWANGRALQQAGIPAGIADPPGGRIVRDNAGEPTGLLLENAMAVVSDLIPPPDAARMDANVRRGMELAHRLGLVGIHVAEGRDALRAFQWLRRRGELTLREHMLLPDHRLEHAAGLGLEAGLGDDWLRLGHIKLFLDGSLGQRTADMLDPYEDEETYRGVAVLDRPELSERVAARVEATVVAGRTVYGGLD